MKKIHAIIDDDVQFLQNFGLLDYSLLLAVEKIGKEKR